MLQQIVLPTGEVYERHSGTFEQVVHALIPLMVVEDLLVEFVRDCPLTLDHDTFTQDFMQSLAENGYDLSLLHQRGVYYAAASAIYELYQAIMPFRPTLLGEAMKGQFVSGLGYGRRVGGDLVLMLETTSYPAGMSV